LVAVGARQPDARAKDSLDRNRFSEGALEKLGHADNQLIDVEAAGYERLAP
jgi:hypothetical protein